MPLNSAQNVRLLIQDQPILADSTYYGDGRASQFLIPHRNLTSASAFVPGAGGWSSTGATFNASGTVLFGTAISANSAFRLTYVHSTFSDEEIDQFITDGGTVLGAGVQALQSLMFDGLKRARWAAPDGTQYDDTAAMRHLNDLHDRLREELGEEAIAGGGINSWSDPGMVY